MVDKNCFEVGDYAYFTRTPKQMTHTGIVNEITRYKIIQVVDKNDGYKTYKVYNTKHGSFNEMQIGRTVFYTEEQAIENKRRINK